MRIRLVTFFLSGLVAMCLDWWGQLELLFSVEVAVVRGMVGLWIIELTTRIGRACLDTYEAHLARQEAALSELVDRVTSTLASGMSLYVLFALWIGCGAILDGMFSEQPYRMFASFIKVGSAFTVSLWLMLNILTFAGGSRRQAHEFLTTLKEIGKRAAEGRMEEASEPVEEYSQR